MDRRIRIQEYSIVIQAVTNTASVGLPVQCVVTVACGGEVAIAPSALKCVLVMPLSPQVFRSFVAKGFLAARRGGRSRAQEK